ncbi:WhiB family transcriptional regulator [Rhodococcus sp. SJ-3]|uniref:WhiB family transcriptional regulator n=1 Tax=Rhodococcus sp. SJ-3 TaxID=3454628 RepID=UPI003F791F2F
MNAHDTFLDWRVQARCTGFDIDTFFGPATESYGARTRRERMARRICSRCSVLEHCRRFAVDTGQPHGIWGGLTESDRRRVRRHRQIA